MGKRWTILLLIGGCLLLCVWLIFRYDQRVRIENISNEAFQHEVLESNIPILVIFCTDELWNRRISIPFYKETSPMILAFKELIKEEKYEGKVKFWRYTVPEGSYNQETKSFDKDIVCNKLNIKWLPTTIVFNNGSIIEKFEGAGCTVEEAKKKIEQVLLKILQ